MILSSRIETAILARFVNSSSPRFLSMHTAPSIISSSSKGIGFKYSYQNAYQGLLQLIQSLALRNCHEQFYFEVDGSF